MPFDLRFAPRIFTPKRQGSSVPSSPKSGRYIETSGTLTWLGDTSSISGVTINDQTAPEIVTYFRCVNIIASTIAALPMGVFELGRNGRPVEVRSVLDSYLWDRPNPEMSRMQMWETCFSHEVGRGDCFLYVEKRMDLPAHLWPIDPSRVRVGRTDRGQKVYEVDREYALADYSDGGELVHIPGFGYNGLRGSNPVRLAEKALALAKASELHATNLVASGSTPSGVLQTDQELSRAQANRIRERWEDSHQGVGRVGRIAILDSGMKFLPVSINPEDAQLLETRKYQTLEIARLFGVPPHLIGEVDRTTSWGTGIEEQGRGFVTYTLAQHIVRFEQKLTDTVLGGTPRFVRFNTEALLRGNFSDQVKAWKEAVDGRLSTPNEARAALNLAEYPDGDEVFVRSDLIPLGMAVQGLSWATPNDNASGPENRPPEKK